MESGYTGYDLSREYRQLEDSVAEWGYTVDLTKFFDLVQEHPPLKGIKRIRLMEKMRRFKHREVPEAEIEFIRGFRERIESRAKGAAENARRQGEAEARAVNRAIESDPELSYPLRCAKWALLGAIEAVREKAAEVLGKEVAIISKSNVADRIKDSLEVSEFRSHLKEGNRTSFRLELRQEAERMAQSGDPEVYRGLVNESKRKPEGTCAPLGEIERLYTELARKVEEEAGYSCSISNKKLADEIRKVTKAFSKSYLIKILSSEKGRPPRVGKEMAEALEKILSSRSRKARDRVRMVRNKGAGVSAREYRDAVSELKRRHPNMEMNGFMRAVSRYLMEFCGVKCRPETLVTYSHADWQKRIRTVKPQLVQMVRALGAYMETGLSGEEGWQEIKRYLDGFDFRRVPARPGLPNILEMEDYELEANPAEYLQGIVGAAAGQLARGDLEKIEPSFLAFLQEAVNNGDILTRQDHPDPDIEYAFHTFYTAAVSAAETENGYEGRLEYLNKVAEFARAYPFSSGNISREDVMGFLSRLEAGILAD